MNKTTIDKRTRPLRFPGIGLYSRKLGVTREHLFMVLTGKRTSTRLMRRYSALLNGRHSG
jgi:hypothetical protein